MKTLILIATATMLSTTAVQACGFLTIYPKEDNSPEARAFRAFPPTTDYCRQRVAAAERFRREDEQKALLESMLNGDYKSVCVTSIIGNSVVTACK